MKETRRPFDGSVERSTELTPKARRSQAQGDISRLLFLSSEAKNLALHMAERLFVNGEILCRFAPQSDMVLKSMCRTTSQRCVKMSEFVWRDRERRRDRVSLSLRLHVDDVGEGIAYFDTGLR